MCVIAISGAFCFPAAEALAVMRGLMVMDTMDRESLKQEYMGGFQDG